MARTKIKWFALASGLLLGASLTGAWAAERGAAGQAGVTFEVQ